MVSKSVWNLPGGPWERLFAGVWNKFNVAVYENADKVLLTTIFPKSGEVNWIMIRVDKILLVPKDFERFEAKLSDKNIQILKQRVPDRHMTYVIVLSPPTTVEFGSKEIGSIVFQKVLSLNEEIEEIKNIAKKEKIELLDLKDASYKDSATILGNPTTLLGLLSIAPEGEEPQKQRMKEFVIGEADGTLFSIDERIFRTFTSIKKGTEEERNYLAQALLEDATVDISPIPIIFDFSGRPLKLDQANPYPYDYEKYGFATRNVGFKVDGYEVSEGESEIKINLNSVSANFMWELFGLGQDEASTLILQVATELQRSNALESIADLKKALEGIKNHGVQKEADAATVMRAIRRVCAIESAYGNIFSGSSDIEGLLTRWIKGKETVHIRMSQLDKRKRLALLYYFIEAIEATRTSGALSEIEQKRLDYILPVFMDLSWFGEGMLQSAIIDRLIGEWQGVLFVNENELPMKLESRVANKFQITGPRKAKLYGESGRGAKEFEIRPLLSCPP